MILELTTYKNGFDKLLTPTKPYIFEEHSSEETKQLAKDMIAAVYHYKGLAVAGNQLGLPWSIAAFRGSPEDFVIFNPQIVVLSEEKIELEEACLSFKHLIVPVVRPKHIKIRFNDLNGAEGIQEFTGLTARTIQHEIDHLQGKMFFETTSKLKLKMAIKKAKKLGTDYEGTGLLKFCKE